MKTVLQFSFLLVGVMSLAGCSYFDTEPQLSGEAVDLTAQQNTVSPTPPVEELINGATDGSVEVYPVDGPIGSGAVLQPQSSGSPEAFSYGDADARPIDTVSAVPVGGNVPAVYSGDASVDVFPLTGPVEQASNQQPQQQFNVVNANTGAPATVYFDHGSATLDATDHGVIDSLVSNNNMARGISVEGFASVQSSIDDPVKRKIANLRMSMKRAIAVSRALIEKGVPGELVTTVAHGENQPASTLEQSRRVEIRGL